MIIKSIRAEYKGPDVILNDFYNKSDIEVYKIYEDNSESKINTVDFETSTLNILEKGPNVIIITYYDSDTDRTYSTGVTIQSIYITNIRASYTGPYIYIPDVIDRSCLEVTAYYSNNTNKILTRDEYTITNELVKYIGVNTVQITDKKEGNYTVIFVRGIRVVLGITAEYKGEPVAVSDNINPDDIIVSLDTVDQNGENRQTYILNYGFNGSITAPNKYKNYYLYVSDYGTDISYEQMLPKGNEILIIFNPNDPYEPRKEFSGPPVTQQYILEKPGLMITEVGDNIKTIIFKDYFGEYKTEITVPGIPKLIDFETIYKGGIRLIGEIIKKPEVSASATWLLDTNGKKEITELKEKEWDFYDSPVVTSAMNGIIRTRCRELESSIKIPFKNDSSFTLLCWYEGAKIEVGKTYKLDEVVMLLVHPDGFVRRLEPYEPNISKDRTVYKEGWNFYGVSFKINNIKITTAFGVEGYIPKESPDYDLKVIYLEEISNREIDVTEKFTSAFMIDDVLYITWNYFLKRVNDLALYGRYILTAPKLVGLSNRFVQDWNVLCIDKDTLKANILKTYREE